MSHLSNQIRTGIAAGSFDSSARTSPFPIYGGSTNPVDTIGETIIRRHGFNRTNLTFPPDLPPVHFNLMETEWTGADPAAGNAPGTLQPIKLFRLPLPKTLIDPLEVQYEQNFAPGSAFGITSALNAAGSALFGAIFNTFKTITMTQPLYRRHSLEFKMAPKSFQEAQTIQRIVFQLRKGMTPKRNPGGGTAGNLILSFPFVYVPYFSPNPKFLYKFKPCVIEKISVNYLGGNSVPAFHRQEGTDPQAVTSESLILTLVLLELEFWLDSPQDATSDYKVETIGDLASLPTNDPFAGTRFFNFGGTLPGSGDSD